MTQANPSASYQPQTREVIVHCRVSRSWISGRVVMPLGRSLLDYVNATPTFLKLRDTVFRSGHRRTARFFTLRRDAISIIIAEDGETGLTREQGPGQFTERPVAFLLENGEVEGRIAVRENVRVSDEVIRTKAFFAVQDGTVRIEGDSICQRLPQSIPLVLVNAGQVIGVADLTSS
jgi:hypothetical protein